LDNRGTGFSDTANGCRWTTSAMARDAVHVLDDLDWLERVHVVGISMGGMIAQELALMAPERIASLALIATIASAMHSMPRFQGIRDLLDSSGIATQDVEKRTTAGFRNLFPVEWLSASRVSDLHDGNVVPNKRWLRKALALQNFDVPDEFKSEHKFVPATPFKTAIRHLSAVLTHKVGRKRFHVIKEAGCNFPILVMTGDSDTLVPPENSKILARMLGVEPIVVKNSGHGLHLQCSAEVNEALEKNISAGEILYGQHQHLKRSSL